MEIELNILNQESKKVGLKIHRGNTKFMTNYETSEKIEYLQLNNLLYV